MIDAPPLIKPTTSTAAAPSGKRKDTRMSLIMQRMGESGTEAPKVGLDMSEYEPVLPEPKKLFVLKRANIKLVAPAKKAGG